MGCCGDLIPERVLKAAQCNAELLKLGPLNPLEGLWKHRLLSPTPRVGGSLHYSGGRGV